jgi:hypothetical protein
VRRRINGGRFDALSNMSFYRLGSPSDIVILAD